MEDTSPASTSRRGTNRCKISFGAGACQAAVSFQVHMDSNVPLIDRVSVSTVPSRPGRSGQGDHRIRL